MGRKKKGPDGQKLKLGAPEHFTGFKYDFLASKSASFLQCTNPRAISAFYDKVTLDFIAKYGEEEPFNKELAEDPPDPEDIEEGDEAQPPPLKEASAASVVLFSKL